MPLNLVPTLTASPNTGELPSALVPCARQDGETLISSKTLIHNSRTMVTPATVIEMMTFIIVLVRRMLTVESVTALSLEKDRAMQ